MATPSEIATRIKQKARQYVLAQGGSEADATAFGNTLVGISWVESGLGQQPVGDNGTSFGLFHTNINGRNLSGIGQRAGSTQQLQATLQNTDTDIDNSIPELWAHFQRQGGAAGYGRNPGSFVANVALTGQRPSRAAWEKVVQQGGYAKGVEIAEGAAAPASGSPLQAAAGLPSASGLNLNIMAAPARLSSENVSANVASRPAAAVNRTPVQGQITSRFGTPFPMDSGATYQGKAYPHFNKGVDFGAPGGSPVTAVVGGTVKLAGDDGSGWGPRVVITDAEGFDHSYGHLDAASVAKLKPGQQVEAGQQIALVASGRAGTSTGPHLSYDIFRGGEPVDPSPWLGQDVREPGIPASAQVPAYLSGATPSTRAGGAAMPSTPFTYTSPYQSQIQSIRDQIAKGQARLPELMAKGDAMTEAEMQEFATLRTSIPDLQKQLIDLTKIDQDERQFAWEQYQAQLGQRADAATGIAGLRQRGFENGLSTAEAIGNILNTAFGQRLDLANILRLIDEGNRTARLQELNTMIAMGELDMAQAAMRFDVQERQAAAELAWTVQAAAKAGWIADEERKNALMFLPEGTHFQPGFEPNGAINATFAKWGIPPMVIGVAEVDRSRFDPENNLRRGAAIQSEIGAPLPAFDTSETTAAADRVRGIAGTDVSLGRTNPSDLNLPAPTNADALISQLPANPNTADIESFLQGLMSADVGIPSSVSAGTPPAESPTWPSGGSVNQVGTAPTAAATAAAQASLQPGQGFSPGSNGGQGQTQLSTIRPPPKDENEGGNPLRGIPGVGGVLNAIGDTPIPGTPVTAGTAATVAPTIWDWLTKKRKKVGLSVGGR